MFPLASRARSCRTMMKVRTRGNWADRLRWWRRIQAQIESAQLRRLGWSSTSLVWRLPVLVVVTQGRRTGKRRETPLTYVRDEEGRLLISGGAVGQTRTPDWVANLRANPACSVIVDKKTLSVRAVELTGELRERGWKRFGEELPKMMPRMAAYEERSRRTIPVFRLDQR